MPIMLSDENVIFTIFVTNLPSHFPSQLDMVCLSVCLSKEFLMCLGKLQGSRVPLSCSSGVRIGRTADVCLCTRKLENGDHLARFERLDLGVPCPTSKVAVRPLFLRKRCLALIIHDRPASVGRLKYSKGARPDSSTNLVSRLFNRSVQGPKIRFLVFPHTRRLPSSPMLFWHCPHPD